MLGVYMEWSQKQHPSMYYVLNAHHCRCDKIYDHTDVANNRNITPERHCSIPWKQNVGQVLLTKYQTIETVTARDPAGPPSPDGPAAHIAHAIYFHSPI